MILSNVTIFDFETTGIDPVEDRVVEMAALRIRDSKVVGGFHTLIHQTKEIHPKAKEAHGIQESDLNGAMDEQLAFRILRNIMGDSLLAAHNAAFDLAFLHFALQRHAGKTFENPFIDTMTISRERHPFPHRLEPMCERYGIQLVGAHRAMNDVDGCWALMQAMHAEEAIDPWVNRLGYLRKYGAPSWTPAYANVFATDNRYEPRTAG